MRNCYNEVPLSCEGVLLCVDESGWGTYAVLLSLTIRHRLLPSDVSCFFC